MKYSKIALIQILLFLLLSSFCLAQENTDEIYVESWNTDHLREQSFKFDLDSTQNEHSEFVKRWNGSGYRLSLRKMQSGKENYQSEYWVVTLQEVLSSNKSKEQLGCNLLSTEACGPGGDYIGDSRAGILFPREKIEVLDKIRYIPFHPIFATRIVKVKSFYVTIKVLSYKMKENEPKKFDQITVSINFKNKI